MSGTLGLLLWDSLLIGLWSWLWVLTWLIMLISGLLLSSGMLLRLGIILVCGRMVAWSLIPLGVAVAGAGLYLLAPQSGMHGAISGRLRNMEMDRCRAFMPVLAHSRRCSVLSFGARSWPCRHSGLVIWEWIALGRQRVGARIRLCGQVSASLKWFGAQVFIAVLVCRFGDVGTDFDFAPCGLVLVCSLPCQR